MFRSPPAARRKTAPYERRNPVELPASLSLFTTSRVVALQTEPFNHTTDDLKIHSPLSVGPALMESRLLLADLEAFLSILARFQN